MMNKSLLRIRFIFKFLRGDVFPPWVGLTMLAGHVVVLASNIEDVEDGGVLRATGAADSNHLFDLRGGKGLSRLRLEGGCRSGPRPKSHSYHRCIGGIYHHCRGIP